jgi:hypothetical protein
MSQGRFGIINDLFKKHTHIRILGSGEVDGNLSNALSSYSRIIDPEKAEELTKSAEKARFRTRTKGCYSYLLGRIEPGYHYSGAGNEEDMRNHEMIQIANCQSQQGSKVTRSFVD